jgi:ATP-dependent exoDNAse (exonuclease V) beta subunit
MPPTLLFVSAGAGSGKTHRLSQILREELVAGRALPAGVIATTFTRKAATELRERVRSDLMHAGQFALANALGQARMGTVNSVCGALLERFTFEVGLPTEQQVIEEGPAGALMRAAIDEVVESAEVEELNTITARLGIADWQVELKAIVDRARTNDISASVLPSFAQRNAGDLLNHFPKAVKIDLDRALIAAIDAALPTIRKSLDESPKKNTTEYLALITEVRQGVATGTAPWSQWVKLSKALPEKSLQGTVARIAELAGRHAEHPRLQEDLHRYLMSIFNLAGRALEVFAARKLEMGVIDFADQEHLMLRALDHPAVVSVLRDELDLLLVDEFQDTSPIQLALFVKLAALAKRTYWVGDVKQAIYGFRGSDATLMQGVLQALASLNGRKEILESSWRSRPPLVHLANAVFTTAFADTLPAEEVQLIPKREEYSKEPPFANWMLKGKNKGDRQAALAIGIRQLIESGYPVVEKDSGRVRPATYGDIAILVRANETVRELANDLNAQGIPVSTAQPGLLALPETVLVLACLRRLHDWSDTVATANILSLIDCQEPEAWLADRFRHLANKGDARLWKETGENAHPVVARLAQLRSQLPLLSPTEALQLVVSQCDLPRRILRWCRTEAEARGRLANLQALLALGATYEDQCRSRRQAATIAGLFLWLNEQAREGLDDRAEPAVDAVKVLTHHSAKGLEWPIVLLTDLSSDVRDRLWSISAMSSGPINVQSPLRDRYIRYWPWPWGMQQKVPLGDEIAASTTAQEFRGAAIEESRRLLYVSMTRARDLLVLARQASKPTGEWLETACAPWLLPDKPTSYLNLPDGQRIPYAHATFEPPAGTRDTQPSAPTLRWPKENWTRSARLPLLLNPSAAEPIAIEIGETIDIGQRLTIAQGTDMELLGNAVHACLAAGLANRTAGISVGAITTILARLGVSDAIPAQALFGQIEALRDWLETKWPNARWMPEISVETPCDNGQVLRGQIDLLVETDTGCVLIDHKATAVRSGAIESVVQRYSGQLQAYAMAIERVKSAPIRSTYLYLATSGMVASVRMK